MLTYFAFVIIWMVALPTLDCCFEKGNIIVFPQNEIEFLFVKLGFRSCLLWTLFKSNNPLLFHNNLCYSHHPWRVLLPSSGQLTLAHFIWILEFLDCGQNSSEQAWHYWGQTCDYIEAKTVNIILFRWTKSRNIALGIIPFFWFP